MADIIDQPGNLPDELTIPLRKLITIGDQVYDALVLREPTAGEFEKMTKLATTNPAGALILLISLVSGIALPIINRIGVRDMNQAGDYLMGFIQPGLPTQTS